MKILVCCDEYPFPPRNGVTIPSSAYITLLKQQHKVDCLVLTDTAQENDVHFSMQTEQQVDKMFVLPRQRQSVFYRLWAELFLGIPSFHAWSYENGKTLLGFNPKEYDVILATPISALDFPLGFIKEEQRLVAAISDCYTSVLANAVTGSALSRLVKQFRVWRMAGIERALLEQCSSVIVQTERDREWIRKFAGNTIAKYTIPITNGVADSLLTEPLVSTMPELVMVANYSDILYRQNLRWFYEQVWPLVKAENGQVTLRVVGKGLDLDAELSTMLANDIDIKLMGYVPNLIDAYRGTRVALAPIFKSYGYINKVAEAFSVGLPVVGDASAFNGLEKSISLGFATIAKTPREFALAIANYLNNAEIWHTASIAARDFALKELSWQSRAKSLNKAVFGDGLF